MKIRLDGKNGLVTGASSGIGQGIAVALAAAGASVGINYRSNMEGAEETARRVREAGQRALVMEADVGDPEQVATMFRRFDAEMGPIDILVANAGHGSSSKPLHETSWDQWDRVLRSNLHGAFLCGREAARRMLATGNGGRIVNISSVHEEACNVPEDGPYCVAKGGVRNLTRAMALELAPYGITVNDVAPGMILTPMNQRALEDANYRADAEAQIPVRRAGTPADIAAMVIFLCSDHASYCTGGTYLVDGGWMLTWPPV
ncbi:MAG TPA: SDR family oxidoreductase [Thermomicrobiales bacterium]|nr:SDR family oxidoreductase [Thermomicrobiales bacterium]